MEVDGKGGEVASEGEGAGRGFGQAGSWEVAVVAGYSAVEAGRGGGKAGQECAGWVWEVEVNGEGGEVASGGEGASCGFGQAGSWEVAVVGAHSAVEACGGGEEAGQEFGGGGGGEAGQVCVGWDLAVEGEGERGEAAGGWEGWEVGAGCDDYAW